MNNIIGSYFHRIVNKLDRSTIQNIEVISRDGQVLANSIHVQEGISPAIIRSIICELDINAPQQLIYNNSGEYTVIGTPLMSSNDLLGVILAEVRNLRKGEQMIATIRTSLETFIEHHQTLQEEVTATSRDEDIIHELLGTKKNELEEQISYKLFKSLKTLGFDLFLLRSVILIELEKKTNTYFNINLDLGYESSIETFKNKVVSAIKANKYLNNQDVVAFYDNNHIVVLKAFLDVGNIGKLYFALDNICHAIMKDLDAAKIFAYRIAYGGIYNNLFAVKKSFQEAEDTIRLGSMFQEDHGIYTADYGLLEHISYYLPPILKQKTVQDILSKLKKADGSIDLDLLFIAEGFVDQCMNLMKTANTLHLHRNTVAGKIEKFKLKTGLDPERNFKDAFLTKMTALSVKIENFGQIKSDQISEL
jgi:carbohydrate diacid regulator